MTLGKKAFRREEIKALIEDGAIYAIEPSRNSRGRWKILHEKKKKGRRRSTPSTAACPFPPLTRTPPRRL